MMLSATCPSEARFLPSRFTGKERDSESGNDYFGARYFASTMGRFLSPDPLMASAKASDPQTWNRYVYGRNNPLRMIDPTGLAEVTADQCAKDKNCKTVNLHVIWDKHGNEGGKLTDKQKAAFTKGQLQNAKDEYGNADIHFNVTFGEGSSSGKTAGDLGLEKGALNVFVSDKVTTDNSTFKGGYAVSWVNQKQNDLPHEMAHQFMGDTQGGFVIPVLSNLRGDLVNDTERFSLRNGLVPGWKGSPPDPFAVRLFNKGASDFQKAITPSTK